MRIGIFFTGGKDSTFTILKALSEGYKIKYLFTIVPKNKDSYMFHSVALEITKIQAKLMNLDHYFIEVSGEKEIEVYEVIEELKNFSSELDFLGIGGIKSKYQYERFKKIANSLNLKLYAPLLDVNCVEYWHNLINNNFKIIITKVSAEGLDENFLAKIIDYDKLNSLVERSKRYGFNLCFEGGEAETLVLDCPLFSKEIKIKNFEIKKDVNSSWIEIKEIELLEKK